mmetsp:Transcript_12309/g.37043  ORF Transcript_12309/g.37043 Transcript_12309/m.37043 type:complete len:200 (+) Transcript_12309:883-1482(+)
MACCTRFEKEAALTRALSSLQSKIQADVRAHSNSRCTFRGRNICHKWRRFGWVRTKLYNTAGGPVPYHASGSEGGGGFSRSAAMPRRPDSLRGCEISFHWGRLSQCKRHWCSSSHQIMCSHDLGVEWPDRSHQRRSCACGAHLHARGPGMSPGCGNTRRNDGAHSPGVSTPNSSRARLKGGSIRRGPPGIGARKGRAGD